MNLRLDPTLAEGYRSRCQIARKLTESWAEANLYCMACEANHIVGNPANSEAVDFVCAQCHAGYQLKAMENWNERRVPDAGYHAMMRALRSDSIPNLLLMQYGCDWSVRNLMLVPSFFFSSAAVQKRKPLGPNARRAGWVGCNILLSEIADDGKIRVISNGVPTEPVTVRQRYETVRPLAALHSRSRGWTLDVLRMVRRLGRERFILQEIYDSEDALAAIYPGNRNVKPKIRQQLQVLRDLGFVSFEGRGQYRLLR